MIVPHPDCRAPHRDDHEYSGPTHACIGKDCRSTDHPAESEAGYPPTLEGYELHAAEIRRAFDFCDDKTP